jgi:hypothetical protein
MANNTGGNDFANVLYSSRPEPVDIASLPTFGYKARPAEFDITKYKVRYLKVDMDNKEDITLLEDIETKGLLMEDIVILTRKDFSFMQQYFMMLCYLEYQG